MTNCQTLIFDNKCTQCQYALVIFWSFLRYILHKNDQNCQTLIFDNKCTQCQYALVIFWSFLRYILHKNDQNMTNCQTVIFYIKCTMMSTCIGHMLVIFTLYFT